MGKQPAHEVEGALIIAPLDREKHLTVRHEIADSMTEDRIRDGGSQRKRRSHERAERLIEAIVRRRDDGFVETAIGLDGVVVTGCRLPHEAVSLANSSQLSCVRAPRCEGSRLRLEA